MTEEAIGRNAEENSAAAFTEPQENESKTAEVTQPQEDNEDEGTITPDMIAQMTSEEFSEYLKNPGAHRVEKTDMEEDEPEEEKDEEVTDPEPPPEDAEPEEAPTPSAPYRSFATEAEYNADREAAVTEAFKKRFKNTRENDELLARIRRSARGTYPESQNPVEDMINDMDNTAAERAGTSVDAYRSGLDEQAEFEAYKAHKAEEEKQREANERIIRQWRSDSESLKQLVPDFDFDTALKDSTFANAIRRGASVAMAYMEMEKAKPAPIPTPPPPAPKRKAIAQNAQSSNRGTGESSINPATMSDKDFAAYLNKQAGRRII